MNEIKFLLKITGAQSKPVILNKEKDGSLI